MTETPQPEFGDREFRSLSESRQAYERRWHLAQIEWDAREGPYGAVLFQLRARARVFEVRALWVLGFLLFIVLLGIGFYVARPILQDIDNIEARVHEETVRLKQDDLDELDARRNRLRDTSAERIPQIWVARQSGTSAHLFEVRTLLDGKTVIALGAGKTVLRSSDGGASWIPSETGTEPFLTHKFVGLDGKIALGLARFIHGREGFSRFRIGSPGVAGCGRC